MKINNTPASTEKRVLGVFCIGLWEPLKEDTLTAANLSLPKKDQECAGSEVPSLVRENRANAGLFLQH